VNSRIPIAISILPMLALLAAAVAPAAAWDEVLVVTTDYTTYGSAATVERADPWTAELDVEPIGSDAVARWHDGLYYVVDRGGSNIQILDPAAGYATLRQFPLGTGRNPQDIAFGPGGTAWVSCYDAALLLKVDTVSGAVLAEIPTDAFADADGLPETGWMQAVGDRLFIACQRLDRGSYYTPVGEGWLLVWDMRNEHWVDVDPATAPIDPVILAGSNPFAQIRLTADGTGLRVGTAGWFGLIDGGFETVDLATLSTGGIEITGEQLGGDLLDFEVVAPDLGYALVSDAYFVTSLLAFDPSGATGPRTVLAGGGYDYADIAWDGEGQIFLADQTLGATGVRVFDAATGEQLTADAIPVGRKPFQIVTPTERPTGVPSASPRSGLRLAAPWPNPANPAVNLRFAAEAGTRVELAVYDLRGRLLRRTRAVAGADGSGSWLFDGRDSCGRPLPSGAYRATARSASGTTGRGFSLVR